MPRARNPRRRPRPSRCAHRRSPAPRRTCRPRRAALPPVHPGARPGPVVKQRHASEERDGGEQHADVQAPAPALSGGQCIAVGIRPTPKPSATAPPQTPKELVRSFRSVNGVKERPNQPGRLLSAAFRNPARGPLETTGELTDAGAGEVVNRWSSVRPLNPRGLRPHREGTRHRRRRAPPCRRIPRAGGGTRATQKPHGRRTTGALESGGGRPSERTPAVRRG